MTALSDNILRRTNEALIKQFVVTNAITVYKGGFYALDKSTGKVAIFNKDSANSVPLGICNEQATGNSAGTVKASFIVSRVEIKGIAVTGASAITDVGKAVYITDDDDNALTLTAPTTAEKIPFGFISGFDGTTFDVMITDMATRMQGVHQYTASSAWTVTGTPSTDRAFNVDDFDSITNIDLLVDATGGTADDTVGSCAAAVTDIDLLVDSTGGTADNTVSDVSTALTGTGAASADWATLTQVNARLVTINNNFKELTDQVISLKTTISDVNTRLTTINANFKELTDQAITQRTWNSSVITQMQETMDNLSTLVSDLQSAGILG